MHYPGNAKSTSYYTANELLLINMLILIKKY